MYGNTRAEYDSPKNLAIRCINECKSPGYFDIGLTTVF
jgi:hypothetical protein